ncbi:MAG: F-type H+-transporting ATPase subunit delta [Blastocatellia bacterium]|jgi:F-type H+-transporting ATPase subunit delta|nr:F-type H+-transporting ATPase subunit delta [Blastocatellia bacterium]
MSVQTVARRYASALADVVLERGEAREVQEELLVWQKMFEASPTLPEVFRNPTIALDKKRAVLNKLIERAKPRPTTANFLKVLLQNQRLTELGEINKKFAELLDLRAGMVAATVTTARSVPENAQQELQVKLTSLTGKKVRLNFTTDPELIGGLVTRIGSTVYDGSVRNHLQLIKEKMAG